MNIMACRQAKYVMKFFQDLFTSVGGSHEKFRSSGGGKDVVIEGYREGHVKGNMEHIIKEILLSMTEHQQKH